MKEREIRVTADWRDEPDWELLAQALIALARQLSEDGKGDQTPPEAQP
jgi:hypothetical protein